MSLAEIGVYNLLRYNQKLIIYPFGFPFLKERGLSEPFVTSCQSKWSEDVVFSEEVYEYGGISGKNIELTTQDKVKLRCTLLETDNPAESRGTVIMFHGNAMDHKDALHDTGMNLLKKNFNVFAAEYRGYGDSEGLPSENGLRLDAQAAVNYVTSDPILGGLPIVIYGKSLGGAVAIHATSKNVTKVSALIIENTFTSIPDMVKEMPVIRWIWFLTTEKWYSASKLSRLPTTLPILMLSGLRDEVIPPANMERLWKVAQKRSCPKSKAKSDDYQPPTQDVFKTFGYGDHNDTIHQPKYWQTVHGFLDSTLGNHSYIATDQS